jgi:hypothetical protein
MMKYTSSKGLLILACFVSFFMLMANAFASAGPPVWINQATLSTIDYLPDEDPENSGFGMIQAAVWEHWNGADWDIYMKYSLADGFIGTWVFPILHPATIVNVDERNPAVTVTNVNINGFTEVHVVYERWNNVAAQWDVCHTYTVNMGGLWTVPVILNNNDARDPAIVYTEEVSNPIPPAAWYGMCIQIVWSELNPVSTFYEILYNAWYYDVPVAVWGYAMPLPPFPLTVIRAIPGGSCEKPEIASVDETMTMGTWEYYFAIVWQEPSGVAPFNTEIWYTDGWLNVRPGVVAITIPLPATGKLNTNAPGTGNAYDPDIAATQDYQNPAVALEEFYFHVNWVFQNAVNLNYQIDTCYAAVVAPMPGFVAFTITLPAQPAIPTILNSPTIASKLIMQWPPFTIFETWMCWEDNSVPASAPDIWYRVGQWNNMARIFGYTMFWPALVPYVQPIGGASEYNPELWNRNDAARLFPPLTHLVFDMTTGLAGNQEVEYIDP